MEDNDLLQQFETEHKEEIEAAQKEVAIKPLSDNTGRTSKDLIEEQRQKDFDSIKNNKDFLMKSAELNSREVIGDLMNQENNVEKKELDNQYAKYENRKRKELLDYRVKYEKGCIKEQAKAERDKVKRENAEKRFGYLYKTEEVEVLENGQKVKKLVYKDFTPSKAINRFKEFENWYKNLTDGIRHIIGTTCKTILKLGMWIAIGGAIYGLVMWLLHSGITV